MMSLGVIYAVDFLPFRMNCSFSCAYDMGADILLLSVARSSMLSIPIAVRSPCCSVVILSKFADMLFFIGGFFYSGVGVSEISLPISSRCWSWLRAWQFNVSAVGRGSGPPLESSPLCLLMSLRSH